MQDEVPASDTGAANVPLRDQRVRAICRRHDNAPGALIEILHDLQDEFGFIEETTLPVVAHAVNLSRAEVYGVFTFYHDFRKHPAGRHVLKLCHAEACQSMGSDRLAAAITRSLGLDFGNTASDGSVTLEAVYCLGNCALAPAAMLDGQLIGRADERRLVALLATAKAAKS